MVKNDYLLLLVLDLIDNIGKKKVFTKMDLWYGYNNIRIKKGNEWKAAFLIPKETFEPTLIFFGLTNSLANFQAVMNDLLRDMIEVGDVTALIDNIMVGTKAEKEYNKIVEDVLRRMIENNLFVKSEKYVWKVREVGFLGVVIGSDRVKMEKKKVQEVVDQPVPRSVKNVQKFLGLANYYRQFVKDFTRVEKSLYEMTRKDVKWN